MKLRRDDDGISIGVTLCPRAVAAVGAQQMLSAATLDSFAQIVEGVSHFLYVVECARRQRATSVLELELQAEVDKFVAATMIVRRTPGLPLARVHRALFGDFTLREGLTPTEASRYRRASYLAKRYTRRLMRHYLQRGNLAPMLDDLRRFYRMPSWEKEARIAMV